MKPQRFDFFTRIGAIFNLLTVILLVGCPPFPPPNGGPIGPPSGVVELDQNTDPRFFLTHRQGTIGRLKIAGNAVRLNGRRVERDINVPNGAHVSTGPASAAIIDFFPAGGLDCGLEIRDFRHGRLYGQAERCGHTVTTDQGAMETRGGQASYHVEARGDGVTVFTAISGEAAVWRHNDPSAVVVVPSYHQVTLSYGWISPPRRVSRGEVASITRWRENFRRWRQEFQPPPMVSVPDLRNREVGEAGRMLARLKLRASINPPNAGSRERVLRQDPPAGAEVKPGTVVRVYAGTTEAQVTVPNLRNRSLADARGILKRLGLGLRYTPRNAKDQYWVYRQDPAPGRRVERGTVVNLTLQAPIY